jgi:hypothetical protein
LRWFLVIALSAATGLLATSGCDDGGGDGDAEYDGDGDGDGEGTETGMEMGSALEDLYWEMRLPEERGTETPMPMPMPMRDDIVSIL